MFLCQGEGLAILGDETFPMKAPATLLAPPGVKHGFINHSSAPMVVSGNFPLSRRGKRTPWRSGALAGETCGTTERL